MFVSPVHKDSFISVFQMRVSFFLFSFSGLAALATMSSIMSNRSDESGYPCLVPGLRGKACNLSPLNLMLAVGFYGYSRVFLCISKGFFFGEFLLEFDVGFCQVHFLH